MAHCRRNRPFHRQGSLIRAIVCHSCLTVRGVRAGAWLGQGVSYPDCVYQLPSLQDGIAELAVWEAQAALLRFVCSDALPL